MRASRPPPPPLWERGAAHDIPGCSRTSFVVLGMLPGLLIAVTLVIASWVAVLSGSAQQLGDALVAERLSAIAPAAGGPPAGPTSLLTRQ